MYRDLQVMENNTIKIAMEIDPEGCMFQIPQQSCVNCTKYGGG